MSQDGIRQAAWGLAVLLLLLGAAMFWLNPATERLEGELTEVQDQLSRLSGESDRRAGAKFSADLHKSRLAGVRAVEGIEEQLQQQHRLLARWFPQLRLTAEEAPTRDGFKAQYTFYQDELRRELGGIAHARRGYEILDLPLLVPDFVKQNREPRDEAEMRRYQRIANLEHVLLVAAGKANGFPYAPLEVRQGWRAASEDSLFQQSRVLLRLDVPSAGLPGMLRSLCELDGDGPIVEIEGLTTRPKQLPERLDAGRVPVVQADVRLVLSTYRE